MSVRFQQVLLRRLDRVRGSGWLDCPNCHEHALQDVVDDMTFLCLGYIYRLTPVRRRRDLVCRRCNYRRRATTEETRQLETAGTSVHAAVLVPIGLAPFLVALIVVLAISGHKSSTDNGLTFLQYDAGKLTTAKFDLPSNYNQAVDVDNVPNNLTATDPSGRIKLVLRRFEVNEKPTQLLTAHFDDDTSINSLGVPSSVPHIDSTKVAGQDAKKVSYKYKESGDTVTIDVYAFEHNGIAYTLTVRSTGSGETETAKTLETHFLNSLSFAGNKETPGPSPSPSPGTSPAPGTSPSPGGGSPSPGATPSP